MARGGGGGGLPYSINRPPASRRLMMMTSELDYVVAETPSIEQLMQHAKKFGVDFVVETAVELGYQFEAVVRLQRQLDVIAREHYAAQHKGMTGSYVAPRKSVEDRVKKLMNITDEEEEELDVAA